jgi:filamentous hemagglutinin family protein
MAPGRTTVGVVVMGALLLSPLAQGQITTDGTLGPAGALAGPHYAIPANLGRQSGANLFHSFGLFNLATGESATFSGPNSVANVISRVTGGQASSIDGTLRSTLPGANLFLINPRGILFGPNASLDLTGSFYASSADYLKFADGTRFEATAATPAVLSVAPPAAFGFLGPTGEIALQGTTFDLAAKRDLSIAGGTVSVNGAFLRTRAADLRLASVASGELPIDAASAPSTDSKLGDVNIAASQLRTLSSGAEVPGRLVIRGGQLTIADSIVRSTNAAPADAPPVELVASDDLRFSGGQLLASTQGAGRGADLVARGENVTIDRAALAQSWSVASGTAGDVDFGASDALRIVAAPEDPAYTAVYNASFADGAGGATRLSGDKVSVEAGIVLNQTSGSGDGGPIAITGREIDLSYGALVGTYITRGATGGTGEVRLGATESVVIRGKDWTGYQSQLASWNAGVRRGGDLVIEAPSFTLREAGMIQSNVYAAGRAGDITIRASRNLEVNGTNGEVLITSIPYYGTTGDGGNVTLESPNILVDGPASISMPTNGAGNTGNILIRTHDIEIRSGTSIYTDVAPWSTGQGGNVTLEGTGRLTMATVAKAPFDHWLLNPEIASIGAFTAGPGRSGDVTISIPEIYGGLESNIVAFSKGSGDAGNITINAERVKLTGRSKITVWADVWSDPQSKGRAGNITLNIGESLEFAGAGDPGLPEERFGQLWMRRGGVELSSVTGGDAGSVVINSPRIVLDDSSITATTWQSGHGGRIEIHTDELILRQGGLVEARAFPGSTGNAGAVFVDARDRIEISGMSPVDGKFSGITAETWGSGRGGDLMLRTGSLLLDRGFVKSSTGGSGDAGAIDIRARDVVLTNGGWIDAGTAPGSTGAGGSVRVVADQAIVVQGVDRSPVLQVATLIRDDPAWEAAFGPGRPQAALPSTISSNTAGAGAGGNVSLTAPSILIADGGRVTANSTGSGNAGAINIVAPDALRLFGGTISSEALASDGGNIDIRVGNLVHLKNSEITTAVGSGAGAGGNITIDPTFVILENSKIVANAFGGPGGNIRIVADYFLSTPDSLIDASSELGVSGNVDISAPRTDLNNGLKPLPAQFFDASTLLRETCGTRAAAGGAASSLVDAGSGGLAASPERFAASSYFAGAPATAPVAESTPGMPHLVAAKHARLRLACAG